MTFDKILLIRPTYAPDTSRPLLVGILGDKMHWSAGCSYCMWEPDKFTIVREYSDDELDRAYDELDRDFAPQPAPVEARLGFVAPNGDYYPCGYCCHRSLERMLVDHFYDGSFMTKLTEKGWVEIMGGAVIGYKDESTPSQEAKNTVRKIVEAFEAEESTDSEINWNNVLRRNPECYSEQNWTTPAGELPSYVKGTYAQEMRRCYEASFGEGDVDCNEVQATGGKLSKRPGEHPGD